LVKRAKGRMLVAKKMKRSLSRIDISRPRLGLGLYIEVNVSRTAIDFYLDWDWAVG
jgi:hypothetical protein